MCSELVLPPGLCPTPGRGTVQHFRTTDPPVCLPTSTLAPSNLFLHIAQGSQSGLVFSLPASICRGDRASGTSPRDASEAIYQMHPLHYICKIHICPLVGSFHQGNREDVGLLMVQALEDELASGTCCTSKQISKGARLHGPWKRTSLCSSWVQRFSALMSRSSVTQATLDNVILFW